MAKKFYCSENNVSDEVKHFYTPNGEKVILGYCSLNGVSKLFFCESKPLGATVTTRIYDTSATVGGVTVTISIMNNDS